MITAHINDLPFTQEVERVMRQFDFDAAAAMRHVQQRRELAFRMVNDQQRRLREASNRWMGLE